MISRWLLILFIVCSFITHTLAEPGENPIFSRLTLSDLFGGLALLTGIPTLLRSFRTSQHYSNIYKASLFFLLCVFVPVLFSLNMEATLLESIILLYLMFVSMLTFITFKDSFESLLLPLIMFTSLIAAAIGIYDAAAGITGLPRLFPARSSGEILSGFRNAGQAGAYFLVVITILFPLRFSDMYSKLPVRTRKLLDVSLVTSLIFLALSGKIAAYIGVFVGVLGYAIMKRNTRTIISLSAIAVLLIVIFINLESIAPRMYERISIKYETRISQKLRGDISEGDFLVTNLGKSVEAFKERPITGSGLGAFVGNYGEHEVHSTYFKMLGETGLIGLLGYVIFVLAIIRLFRKRGDFTNQYSSYLRSMVPLLIGCFISWAYTYHMRKREFWLLLGIILITVYKGYQASVKENNAEENNGQL